MATEKDLINAVRDSMKDDGLLDRMKAEMRCEVLRLLGASNSSEKNKKPELPSEIFILNELIREYLLWMKYKSTLSVFSAESSSTKQPPNRKYLAKELSLKESDKTKDIPLLFCILETFKELNNL